MPRTPHTDRSRLVAAPPRIATRDTRAVTLPPKRTANELYLSAEWRGLVGSLIAARGRRCETCGRTGRDSKALRIFGDHIVELRDGGAPFDPRNTQLLCGACHTSKTAAARAARMAWRPQEGVDPA